MTCDLYLSPAKSLARLCVGGWGIKSTLPGNWKQAPFNSKTGAFFLGREGYLLCSGWQCWPLTKADAEWVQSKGRNSIQPLNQLENAGCLLDVEAQKMLGACLSFSCFKGMVPQNYQHGRKVLQLWCVCDNNSTGCLSLVKIEKCLHCEEMEGYRSRDKISLVIFVL